MSNKKTTLKKILGDDLNNFENVGLNDENKIKGLNAIGKEMNLVMAEEKQKKDLAFRERQLKLDSEKLELNKQQFEFEKASKEQSLKNEKEKNELEKNRLDEELNIKKEELASTKRKEKIAIITAIGTFVVTLVSKVIYASLAHNAQRHDYEDYKLESPSSKEQRNNLLNK